jgi:lipoprotein-releasing system permease protein
MFGFAFTVATRFLREGRFQSWLILIGVAAGVGVVTYISALIDGLQTNTVRRTLGAQAHVVVKPFEAKTIPSRLEASATIARDVQPRAQRTRSIDNWQAMVAEMVRTPNIIAVTPVTAGAGLAIRGEASRSVSIVGVDLDSYDRVIPIKTNIEFGSKRIGPGEILIGLQLGEDLGVSVGERITLRTGGGGSGGGGGGATSAGSADTLKIVGIFDLGSRDLNRRQVYVTMKTAQNLLNLPGGATNIYARTAELFNAKQTAQGLRQRTGMEVESWMESNAQLLSALSAQSFSTGIIRVFTAIVVMLGIASVLVVSVVQKRKEIGILRAMGATRWQMTSVFLMQGAIVGFVGSVAGVLLARAMVWLFMTFVKGQDGAPLFELTVSFQLGATVAGVALICGLLAAAAPARRAAQLDPAQAIRL